MPESQELGQEQLEQVFTEAASQASVAAPPTDPVAAPPAEAAAEAQLSAAFRAAQEAGIDIGQFKSDDELVRHFAKQVSEYRPYVEYANQVLPYDKDLREMIAAKSKPPVQETAAPKSDEWTPETHFRKAWGQPDYDKSWEGFVQAGMVTIDPETGQFVADPRYAQSVPINVLQGLNNRRQWQRQALERLLENPFEETWKAMQEPLERYVQDRISQHFQKHDSVRAINAWEAENAKVLYEHDATGNIVYDVYGNMKPTQYGEVFIQAARDARQRFNGISHEDVIRYASAVATPYLQKQPAPVTQQQQPDPPQQQKTSFLQNAMQKAAHSPNSGGYSEASDIEPVVLQTRELDNMFVSAAKKNGGL